jgi:hypothetical protein
MSKQQSFKEIKIQDLIGKTIKVLETAPGEDQLVLTVTGIMIHPEEIILWENEDGFPIDLDNTFMFVGQDEYDYALKMASFNFNKNLA